MKKLFKALAVLVLCVGFLTACGSNGNGSSSTGSTSGSGEGNVETYKVLLLIPGNLGDKSFFDAANAGVTKLASEAEFETKVIEMGADETKFEPTFLDAVEGDWDIIISGNAASDTMNAIAEQYPDQKFINFDNSGTEAPANVYSVTYATNEASFLAGAVAGLVTKSDMELANPEQLIGFLGGMDIPGINDFLVGYIQGALHTNEDVKVVVSYAGVWTDPAKGKELGLTQYDLGVDISFNVAGQTGLGLLDAALEKDKYAIGVDSDQAMLYKDSEPEKAEHVVTSVVKKIDVVIYDAVHEAKNGTLEFGQHQLLGLKEGAVGLADNEFYQALPEEIKAEVVTITNAIIAGEIEVKSGFEMTTEEIASYRDSVRP